MRLGCRLGPSRSACQTTGGRVFALNGEQGQLAVALNVVGPAMLEGAHGRLLTLLPSGSAQPHGNVRLHKKEIRDMAWHPDGNGVLLAGSQDETASFSSLLDARILGTIAVKDAVWSVLFRPAAPHLVQLATKSGKVRHLSSSPSFHLLFGLVVVEIFLFDRRMVGDGGGDPVAELTGSTGGQPGISAQIWLPSDPDGFNLLCLPMHQQNQAFLQEVPGRFRSGSLEQARFLRTRNGGHRQSPHLVISQWLFRQLILRA